MAGSFSHALGISNQINSLQREFGEVSRLLATGDRTTRFGSDPASAALVVRLRSSASLYPALRANAISGQQSAAEAGRIAEQVRGIAVSLQSALRSVLAQPVASRRGTVIRQHIDETRAAISSIVNSASEGARRLIDGSYANLGTDNPSNVAQRDLLFGDLRTDRISPAIPIRVGDASRGGGEHRIAASALNPTDTATAETTPSLGIRTLNQFRDDFRTASGTTAAGRSDQVLNYALLAIDASITGNIPDATRVGLLLGTPGTPLNAVRSAAVITQLEDYLIDPVVLNRLVAGGATLQEAREAAPRYTVDGAIAAFGASSRVLRETADFVTDIGDIVTSAADRLSEVDVAAESQRLAQLNVQIALANQFLGQFLALRSSSINRLLDSL